LKKKFGQIKKNKVYSKIETIFSICKVKPIFYIGIKIKYKKTPQPDKKKSFQEI
jgi:hypothetical protein